jgi:hypothetical protein
MNFVVLPPQTLGDPDPSPLRFRQKAQCTRIVGIEELLWNEFEQRLRQNDMAVFVFIVAVSIRVVKPGLI